ncbi:hypothetical protein CLAFUW4_03784 [Fulvia fulva]|uniref:DDH domain-containing protein n=1 Tax=Passalora fulva TaxID=5499 RepID=A0A9Q8P5U3_PASFU|nr:uncharacterized protein CLAFUR5_03756 [Fulvia fulva]KAK4631165.1 hypothetical protein CLAFUR4_03772 [Fulvia fulva]KAK4633992.1 hypothetical protein CLAFUR0_03771 [Fulvia fulva]UJO14266.1 hypothetical protein CLAFUR5_03756 [Fulvia fulva]WPV10623.1 hypothetical protein CLAFUW4_03784 [Fulvia fulva]WPV26457.1 hypothetical protein CLAFUW7_03776 [Fulvia fulva]
MKDSSIMYDTDNHVLCEYTARPGWFDLEDIDERGLPTRFIRHNAAGKWKFWTHGHDFTAGAMRSYVTSSGTCSLDLGVPTFARHENIMLREAYRGMPPRPDLPIERLWERYQHLVLRQDRDDSAIKALLKNLSEEDFQINDSVDKFLMEKHTEMACDLKGKRDLLTGNVARLVTVEHDDIVAALVRGKSYAKTIVMGHPNPDADSIVSAVSEAARRTLLDPDQPCMPYAESMPPEVAHILGSELADIVVASAFNADNEVVLVDCQSSPDLRRNLVKAVVNHHPVTTEFPYYVARSSEVSWSTTLQVYFKYLGSGFDLGPLAAKVLAEATIVEAEPELMETMSTTDNLAMTA